MCGEGCGKEYTWYYKCENTNGVGANYCDDCLMPNAMHHSDGVGWTKLIQSRKGLTGKAKLTALGKIVQKYHKKITSFEQLKEEEKKKLHSLLLKSNLEEKLVEIDAKSSNYENYIKEYTRQLKYYEEAQKKLREDKKELTKRMHKKTNSENSKDFFNKLEKLSFVKKVMKKGNKLVLLTKNLKTIYNKKPINFGSYYIVFNPRSENSKLEVFREKMFPMDSACQHIFVSASGKLCFGDNRVYGETMQLINEGELDVAATMVWMLLNNLDANHRDPRVKLRDFINAMKEDEACLRSARKKARTSLKTKTKLKTKPRSKLKKKA